MTHLEFSITSFGKGDKAIYKGVAYQIKSVDFVEELIGMIGVFDEDDKEEITWVRCESIEYIPAIN